jgi:deoxyribose-phosphate aldolase
MLKTLDEVEEYLLDEKRKEHSRQKLATQLGPYNFNACLDNTLLDPMTGYAPIEKLVHESIDAGTQICTDGFRLEQVFNCINPTTSRPRLAVVAAFDLGTASKEAKLAEVEEYLCMADEIDLVANTGLLLEEKYDLYKEDLDYVAQRMQKNFHINRNSDVHYSPILKVIINSWALPVEKIWRASEIVASIGQKYQMPIGVKNSTGFAIKGYDDVSATPEQTWIMRNGAGPYIPRQNETMVKSAGGIKTATDALDMMIAGGLVDEECNLICEPQHALYVVRIGTSNAKKITDEFRELK